MSREDYVPAPVGPKHTVDFLVCTRDPCRTNMLLKSESSLDTHDAWHEARDARKEAASTPVRRVRPPSSSRTPAGVPGTAQHPDTPMTDEVDRLWKLRSSIKRGDLAARFEVSLAKLDRWLRGDVRPEELDALRAGLDS